MVQGLSGDVTTAARCLCKAEQSRGQRLPGLLDGSDPHPSPMPCWNLVLELHHGVLLDSVLHIASNVAQQCQARCVVAAAAGAAACQMILRGSVYRCSPGVGLGAGLQCQLVPLQLMFGPVHLHTAIE